MKKILNKKTIPWLLLFLFSSVIWFAGPFLVINHTAPLLSPEKRIYLIALLFLGWALIHILKASTVHTKPAKTPPSELMKKLQLLQARFLGAMAFLKKTTIHKHGRDIHLSELPWYLLIGPASSGKTSLLANANVHFILSKQFKPESLKNISASDTCDWWATRDAVFVDVPSTYLSNKEPFANLWYRLLNYIKQHRKKNALSGIVVTLNLPELAKQNYSLDDLKRRIRELKNHFGQQLPVYLVITKCDLLPGFTEYFNDYNQDELAQVWGVTLPVLKEHEKLQDIFTQRFNALIKRVNKQLLWRLHQERNLQSRPLIKDFPLHIERVKESISNLLKSLNTTDLNLCLQSVYLTSAIQFSSDNPLTLSTQNALQIIQAPTETSRTYFITQLLMQGLFVTPAVHHAHAHASHRRWYRRIIYTAATAVVTTAAVFLGEDFQHGVQQAYSLQNELSQYQLFLQQSSDQNERLSKILPLLNSLQHAAVTSRHRFSNVVNILSFYSNKSQQTAQGIYSQALQAIVLPEIKNNLENYLQASTEKNPERLYSALKAYLMLGDAAEHRQADFVAATVKTTLPQNNEELYSHIVLALTSAWKPMKLNEEIIARAQKQLSTLLASELAYVILKSNHNQNNAISLHTVFTNKTNSIPEMFTRAAFDKIIAEEIPTAATEAIQGNWVTGEHVNPANLSAITDQLRTQYIHHYADRWENFISTIQLAPIKNLQEMENTLALLISDQSPLLQLLNVIQDNTSPEFVLAANPKLKTIHQLLANNQTQTNTLFYKALLNFKQIEENLFSISHSEKTILQLTSARMLNRTSDPIIELKKLAAESPAPFKNWLDDIATQTWRLEMIETSQYLDKFWQMNIVPTYNAQIVNHYPFSTTAQEEVDLNQFTLLLGGQGLLANFYQHLLKPFIDDSKKEWQWKKIDNEQLAFSNEFLAQLQHVLRIQHAFFPNGDNKLFVSFTLQPTALQGNAKNVTLSINGQEINYEKEMPPIPYALSWPGKHSAPLTTIHFTSKNNQIEKNSLAGKWGWFRLVNQSTEKVIARNELMLKLEMNQNKAKYLLFTQGHFNPFLPLNLQKLQLPQKLVE